MIKKTMSIILMFTFVLTTFIQASGEGNVCLTIFDEQFVGGQYVEWEGTHVIETDSQYKVGKKSLMVTFLSGKWQGATKTFDKALTQINDVENSGISLYVKIPRKGTKGILQIITNNNGRTVMANLPISSYVSKSDWGKWAYVQIPFSKMGKTGESWSDQKGYNETIEHNYSNIVGIGFKADGTSFKETQNIYIDEFKIVNGLDSSKNTAVSGRVFGETIEIDKTESKDGSYYDIFKDSINTENITIWSGNSNAKIESNRFKEGFSSLKFSFDKGNWHGANLYFNNIVSVDKEKLDDYALSFWINAPKEITFTIGLKAQVEKNEIKGEFNVYDYLYEDQLGEWANIVVPFSSMPSSGIFWNNITQTNDSIAFPFDKITGLSITVNTSGEKGNFDFLLDDIKIIDNTQKSLSEKKIWYPKEEFETLSKSQTFNKLDLTPHMNMAYKDEVAYDKKGGWIDQGLDDMRNFDLVGEHTYNNVPFDIIQPTEKNPNSCIVLRGQNRMYLPTEVVIPVDKKADGIYFLHTAAWLSGKAGEYIINYSDGTRVRTNAKNKINISDWGTTIENDISKTVIQSKNNQGKIGGFSMYAYSNPYPQKTIKDITIKTKGDDAFLIVEAITLSNGGPYMPETQKYPEANPDTSKWFNYQQPNASKMKDTPLDMSWARHKPAGKYGFVTQKGEKFYFENGEEARFIGTNVVADCIFAPKEEIDILVERLSASGYNLVRFHHMDAAFSNPNIFGVGNTQTLQISPEQLDKFHYFTSELIKRGIYLYVDTIVMRSFKKGELPDEVLPGVADGAKIQNHFEDSIQERQKEYIKQLFTSVNPYTGKSLANEPALVFTEIHNEDSILWRPALGWAITTPYYVNKLQSLFNNYLNKKYKDDKELAEAWRQEGRVGLEKTEQLKNNSVLIKNDYLEEVNNYSVPRLIDTRNFLYDTQVNYYNEMYDYMRNEIGLKCMIAGSNAPETEDTADIYANISFDGEFVDRHNYYNHPVWNEWDYRDGTTIGNGLKSMLDVTNESMVQYFGSRKVYNMPYMLSEWNSCEPNQYLSESQIMMSAYSSLNNWNTVQFAFLQGRIPTTNTIGFVFNAIDHPTRTATIHATTPMFLRHDVKEAQVGYYVPVSREKALNPEYYPQIPKGLPMVAKSGLMYTDVEKTSPDVSYNNEKLLEDVANANGDYVSVTGQLRWNEKERMFEINTDGTQGFSGFPNGKKMIYEDVDIDIENYFSSITLTSITQENIKDTSKLLLTATARVRNTGTEFNDDGKTIIKGGGAPLIVEPVIGDITLKTFDEYKVYALTSDGIRTQEVPVVKNADGTQTFNINEKYKTLNYEIVKTKDSDMEFVTQKPVWAIEKTYEKSNVFNDISNDYWANASIANLKYKDIVKGDENNNFNPEEKITKGEFVQWLVKALDLKATSQENFGDVDKTNPYFKEISTAKKLGLIFGDENNNFKPNENLTRQEMMVIGGRVLVNEGKLAITTNYSALNGFYDANDISDYAKGYLSQMVSDGIIKGYNNNISPMDASTRVQCAEFLTKLTK